MQSPVGPRRHSERPLPDPLRIDLSFSDIRSRLSDRWPRLDANDLTALESEYEAFVAGNYQLLVGRLREHYGLSQSVAEEQVRHFVATIESRHEGPEHSASGIGIGRSRSAPD